jgi:dGTPase
LNEDLIEALALFHDIGHPPFGHAGEDALNECLADHGGFSHNRYALVIAEQLESRYQSFPGLNLTYEVSWKARRRASTKASAAWPRCSRPRWSRWRTA